MKNKKDDKQQKEAEINPSPPPEELGLLTKEQFEKLLIRASQPRRKEPDQEVD